jgi:tetratricopeptide (TPR) repeat protein
MYPLRAPLQAGLAPTPSAPLVAIESFEREFVSHGQGAAIILDAVAAPDCPPLGHAYAGALRLFLQTAEGVEAAAGHLAAARDAARDAVARHPGALKARDQMMIEALSAWGQGRVGRAVRLHLEAARQWPTDRVHAKLVQVHQLSLGDRAGMHAFALHLLDCAAHDGYLWGLAAFALEQADDPRGALAAAMRAVALQPDDAWAHHAGMHALSALDRPEEALAWGLERAAAWERCSSFMYTHNWWHIALLRLRLGQPEEALALFDQRVWGVRKNYVQDQINAIALLSRLELYGVEAGERRWRDLAAYARERTSDHLNGFLDLHYAYALARAGDEVGLSTLCRNLPSREPDDDEPHAARLWAQTMPLALEGMIAHAKGAMVIAADRLEQVMPRLAALGGSTAQQAWFQLLLRDAQKGGHRRTLSEGEACQAC